MTILYLLTHPDQAANCAASFMDGLVALSVTTNKTAELTFKFYRKSVKLVMKDQLQCMFFIFQNVFKIKAEFSQGESNNKCQYIHAFKLHS